MCASGVRSAIAHRVLTQAGMDSASLSGGILTLRATLGARASDILETERCCRVSDAQKLISNRLRRARDSSTR